ncbi:solute carrier family 35 member F1-like [Paramacrobiotus metropolitanus]|uniref:solute carrier family 35 member F1-like n=1 Tax=Paramacrobiotus metropolitanus TaxID=2943436 RepID=UPI002445C0AA|nr:solute carrier family 35 member F1-like [Paramacrobiotus metropolitanus]
MEATVPSAYPVKVVGAFAQVRRVLEKLQSQTLWTSFVLGQVCSIFVCGSAVTSTWLTTKKNVNCPTAQSFLNYVLIGLVYSICLRCQSKGDELLEALRRRWWKYLILAVIDVEANYLMVKAYQYTTLTSVQLLDCSIIPIVLILSCVVLRYRFHCSHYIGVLFCVGGAVCMVLGDVLVKKSEKEAENRLIGDLMVFGGSVLYAFSNVSEEYIVKKYSRLEFLSMLGIFGSVVNGIQLVALERHEVQSIKWQDWEIVLCLLAFAGCMFGLYSLVPLLMRRTGATVFNMSILSADFYALIIGLTLFSYQFHYIYFIGFTLVVTGLVTYAAHEPSTRFDDENKPDETTALSLQSPADQTIVTMSYRPISDSFTETVA